MHKKKGSLSLSINAIVVLILAITMLGLGLGFIRGMFGKVSSQMEGLVENEPEPPTASASNPISPSRTTVVADKGEEVVIKFSVYNTGTVALTASPAAICDGISSNAADHTYSTVNIAGGATGMITAILKTGVTAGKSICSFSVGSISQTADVIFIIK